MLHPIPAFSSTATNLRTEFRDGRLNSDSSTGFHGIRLTWLLMLPCFRSSAANSSACSNPSFSPAKRQYSNVTRLPVASKYCTQSDIRALSGYALALGTMLSRSFWFGAWIETANVDWVS